MPVVPSVLLVATLLAGCGTAATPVDEASASTSASTSTSTPTSSGVFLTVDDATTTDLVFLREEEKMARDVYITLGQRWNLGVFANIQESEQRHMDAVLSLLVSAGIPDPAAGNDVGVFTNVELGSLYASLVEQGSAGEIEALVVGATIEDRDLADLAEYTLTATDPTVLNVYANLSKGSRNHLRAFVGHLVAAGATYTPQFLDAATYEAIVSSPTEKGN
jgi:hypothetical protein